MNSDAKVRQSNAPTDAKDEMLTNRDSSCRIISKKYDSKNAVSLEEIATSSSSMPNHDNNNNGEVITEEGNDNDKNDDNDNKNSSQRATVICRQIDPNRLKNSGLGLQIAQILHQKILRKKKQLQQQKEHSQQQNVKKENDQKEVQPMTTTNVVQITMPTANISSLGDTAVPDQKPQSLTTKQSNPKVLSVPKITITSPPCDTGTASGTSTEFLRENKCERLEDVKRILNRQILLRKLANNASNVIAIPLSSRTEQPKRTNTATTTTLQLPPQTTIKTFRKSELPPTSTTNSIPSATTAVNASPPTITVRKFHTIASPEVIMKGQCTQTLPKSQTLQHLQQQQQTQSQSQVFLTSMSGGTTIRPIIFSNTARPILTQQSSSPAVSKILFRPVAHQQSGGGINTVMTTQQNSSFGTNIFHQSPESTKYSQLLSNLQTTIISSKAIIRPNAPQLITLRPITTLSKSARLSTQTQQAALQIMSPSIPTTQSHRTTPTISVSKPKVFEIHGLKQLKQPTSKDPRAKKPNIMKASLECNNQLLSISKKEHFLREIMKVTETTAAPSKIDNSNVKSEFMNDDDNLMNLKVPECINKIPKQQRQPITYEQEKEKFSSTEILTASAEDSPLKDANNDSKSTLTLSQKTENVPIVLENKLLKPGEQIDLKGLLSKSNDPMPQKRIVSSKGTVLPDKPINNKMHIIISNEKLKSPKADMAALAKQVLERAAKSPKTAAATPAKSKVPLTTMPKKPIEKVVESSDTKVCAGPAYISSKVDTSQSIKFTMKSLPLKPTKKVVESTTETFAVLHSKEDIQQSMKSFENTVPNVSKVEEHQKSSKVVSTILPAETVVESNTETVVKSGCSSSKENSSQRISSLKKPIENILPNMSTEVQHRAVIAPITVAVDALKVPPTKFSAKQTKTVVSSRQNLTSESIKSSTNSIETKVPKRRPAISKASMSRIEMDCNQPIRQKARLREKVLSFCGIKDQAQLSPIKGYPKTVEIVDEEDVTDEDTSMPTAVDFIASLSMLNCTNPVTDEETDTDAVHQIDILSSNDIGCGTKVKEKAKGQQAYIENIINPMEFEKKNSPAKGKERHAIPSKVPPMKSNEILKGNAKTKSVTHDVVNDTLKDSAIISSSYNDDTVEEQEKHLSTMCLSKRDEQGIKEEAAICSEKSKSISFKLEAKSGMINTVDVECVKTNPDGISIKNVVTQKKKTKKEQEKTKADKDSSSLSNEVNKKDADIDILLNEESKDVQHNVPANLQDQIKVSKKDSDALSKKTSKEIELSDLEYDVPKKFQNQIITDKGSSEVSAKVCVAQSKILKNNSTTDIEDQKLKASNMSFGKDSLKPISEEPSFSGSISNIAKDQTIKGKDISSSSIEFFVKDAGNHSLQTLKDKEWDDLLENNSISSCEIVKRDADTNSMNTSQKDTVSKQINDQVNSNTPKQLPAQSTNAAAVTTTRKRIGIRNAAINLIARKKSALKSPAAPEPAIHLAKDNVNVSVQKDENTKIQKILESNTDISVEKLRAEKLQTETEPDSPLLNQQDVAMEPCTTNKPEISKYCQAVLQSNKETIKNKPPSPVVDVSNDPIERSDSARVSAESTKNQETSSDLDKKTESKVESENHLETKTERIEAMESSSIVLTMNLETHQEERHGKKDIAPEKIPLRDQNYESHGIKILATVPFADGSSLCTKGVEGSLSLTKVQDPQPPLPEVGTIIDMKAYGIDKMDAEIILFQNLLNPKNQEFDQEESTKNSEKSMVVKDNFETDLPQSLSKSLDDKDRDSQSCHSGDINDYSNNDSPISVIGRKRLRRKRPISTFLSTSGSEDSSDNEEETKRSLSRTEKISALRNEISSTSASSELFGFPEKSLTITSTTDEKRQTMDEELISTTISTTTTMKHSFDSLKKSESESKYTSPFVTIGSRRNVPLKKRWELSKHPSHDETDITDDTSPAADDDTMDDEEIENKILAQPQVEPLKDKKLNDDILESRNDDIAPETVNVNTESDEMMMMKTSQETVSHKESFINATDSKSVQSIDSSKRIESSPNPANPKLVQADNLEKDHKEDVLSRPPAKRRGRPPKKVKKDDNISVNSSLEINIKIQETESIGITSTPIDVIQKKGARSPRIKNDSADSSSQIEMNDDSSGRRAINSDWRLSLEVAPNADQSGASTTTDSVRKKRGRKPRLDTSLRKQDRRMSMENQSQIKVEEFKSTENTPAPTPKKRGRKPRQSVINITQETQSSTSQMETEKLEDPLSADEDDMPLKKKRGRKPRLSVINITQEPQSSTSQLETEKLKNPLHSDEADVPIRKKPGRKPRLNIAVAPIDVTIQSAQTTHDETSDLESPVRKKRRQKAESSQEDIVSDESTIVKAEAELSTCTPKSSSSKLHAIIIPNESQESNIQDTIQETPQQQQAQQTLNPPQQKCRGRKRNSDAVDDFNPRLLLIRRRDQLNTEEVLTVADSEAGNGPLQCGLCLARTTRSNWYNHLGEHYGIGWIVGNEPAINIKSRSKVLNSMTSYFKQKETSLLCRICSRSYRSSLGLLLHFESCGETIRVKCPTCGNQYTKLSYAAHQRTCEKGQSIENDKDEKERIKTTEPVFNNSGRLKRVSVMKAETKLKKLTKELSENEALFQPKDFIKFQTNTTEGQNEKGTFYCTVCAQSGISFRTEADAIKHVLQNHKQRQQSAKDFEADSSDFDGNSEGSEESEEESSIDTDISSAESDVDKDKDDNNVTSKKGSKKTKSKVNKKRPFEPKRQSSFRAVYSQRRTDVHKLVLHKWKRFIRSHFTDEILYPYAISIYDDKSQNAIDLMVMEIESMKFTFSIKHKPFSVLGTPECLEWQNLQRFQTIDQRPSDKLIFLGAPIKTLAWVPLPETVSDQYLVVSCRKDMSSFTRYKSPKSEDALLIVYKLLAVADDSNKTKRDFHAKIHYVLYVPNGPVHTISFLPSGGYDLVTNRLGLLAVGTASSNISVYALPLEPIQFEEVNIKAIDQTAVVVSLKPAFELLLDATTDTEMSDNSATTTQCVHICWSEFSGHQHIFASYANSFIAIWDIKESDTAFYNLNCHIRNGRRSFSPLNYFYFGEKILKAFAIHYDTIGPRWLAVQGCVRKLIVYDIRNLSYPVPIKEDFLKNVPRDIDWSPIWEAFVTVFCDAIPNHGSCAIAFNPVGINFTHSKMDSMLCGVSTLHYNPWQSIYGIGVDNGDIIYMNTRELNNDQQVLVRSKKNVTAISVLDIKRLDGGELIRPKSNAENTDNWYMNEKDFKENYGLVFTHISKLTAVERSVYLNDKRKPSSNFERFMRINMLRWNLNTLGKRYIAIGYENGFLRLTRFKRDVYFD